MTHKQTKKLKERVNATLSQPLVSAPAKEYPTKKSVMKKVVALTLYHSDPGAPGFKSF